MSLHEYTRTLLRDERGAGTVWGLFSFVLFVGVFGMAVDITDAFRARTMLQATADAAALAAAIDLPEEESAAATARAYAARNMSPALHGTVLAETDVETGAWDPERRMFDRAATAPDAVRVTVRRANANGNPLPATFLRIIGLREWDINTRAVAQRFIPRCLRDGLVARGLVDISSNNEFLRGICLHGQGGVHMQNHNRFEPGVRVSMPEPAENLVLPAGGMESNPGLAEALAEDILDPRMVNHVEEIIAGLAAMEAAVTPDYIDTTRPVVVADERFDLRAAEPGRVYHLQCAPNKQAAIPADASLSRVVIVSDCRLQVGAGAALRDVVLASRAAGSGGGARETNIQVAANAVLGADDACAPGGGVQVFSNGGIHFASSTSYHGVQIVAAGDVDLGARERGVNGISVQSGGDIAMTSNNAFGLCSGGVPRLFTVWYYRLVL